jgi:hypothetical protein
VRSGGRSDLQARLDPSGNPPQDVRVAAVAQRKVFLAALLALPALLAVVAGVAGATAYEYFSGTVLRPGSPSGDGSFLELHNLDPEYRIGCDLHTASGVLAPTRMRTLELLVHWFGPVPGSYQGPYPEHVFVEPTALAEPLVVDGQAIQLRPADIKRALGPPVQAQDDPYGQVALKIFEDTCLLLGHWSGGNYDVDMIDTSRVGWFAHYVYSPDPY